VFQYYLRGVKAAIKYSAKLGLL